MESNRMQMDAAIKSMWKSPAAWILALAALGGEFAAVLYFSPNSVGIPVPVVLLILLAFFAESALIGLVGNRVQGNPIGLVDSVMSTLVNLPRLIFARVILLLIPAAYLAITSVMVPVLSASDTITYILMGGLLPLMAFSQLAGFFAICYIMVLNYGAADAVSQAFQDVRNRLGRILLRISPLLILDAVLVIALILAGFITYRSAFILTVTEEMARNSANALVSSVRYGQAGDYMVVNRLANTFMDGILHARGLDLSSMAVFVIQKEWAGILLVILSIPLILLRVGIQERTFFDLCAGASARTNAQWKEREGNLRTVHIARMAAPSGETESTRT